MDPRRALLTRLADGEFHSGAALARDLGRSRTAVWKAVRGLGGAGLEIFAVRGRGYRLADPLELLDADRIREGLDAESAGAIERLEVVFTLPSTNEYLLQDARLHGRVVLAEFQTAGRGRRGNRWLAPLGSGLCESLGWRFESSPESLMMLSLFSAVAALRALQICGVRGVGLKWPNDLVHDGRKLGGILVESRGQVAGAVDVVIGLGLNVRLPRAAAAALDQPVTDLASIGAATPSRNRLAALLIAQLLRMCRDCQAGATAGYLQEWRGHDEGKGRPARLRLPDRELVGTILGIDEHGLLVMHIAGREQRFSSGELSLRLAP